jgi:ferrochelatase
MAFRKEPLHPQGNASRTGIVLVNLGTPDAPTAAAVRSYLKEFLSDPRVIEIPRALWWLVLNGVVLPFRSSRSAAKYASIWTGDGSPLKVWTEKQALLLPGLLGARGHEVAVEYAMRYGNPSIASVLDRLKEKGCERILVLSLYPQYSATTTASTIDAVNAWCAGVRNLPEFRFVKHYQDDPAYISALAVSIATEWEKRGREIWPGEKRARLVMSFHGIPKRNVLLGDPYQGECLETARLLAEKLGLPKEQVEVCFQSRFGKAEWLQPYTFATLAKVAKKEGVNHVDICCPGFPADCLETLEEIAIEGKATFLKAGGGSYRYLPCMNDSPAWIAALGTIAERHLSGWPTGRSERGSADAQRSTAAGSA